MKRCDDVPAFAAFTGRIRYIYKGIIIIFFLVFFGCATIAPQPVTIRHERTPSLSDATMQNQQSRKEPADHSTVAQEQLKKNVINAEEAGRNIEQSAPSAVGEKGAVVSSETIDKARAEVTASTNQDHMEVLPEQAHRELPKEIEESAKVTESVSQELKEIIPDHNISAQEQLKGNVITPEETGLHTEQSAPSAAGEAGAVVSSETNERQAEKIATSDNQEGVKVLPEQAQEPVRDELPRDIKEKEKEQDEEITRNISQELGKGLSEQVKEHVREESPAESKESEQQRIDRITARVTQELMKSLPELIRKQVQEELPREIKVVEKRVEEKVEQKVDRKVEEKVVEQTASLPDWIKRVHFGGDIRLRYERDFFDKNNAVGFTTITQGTAIDTRQLQDSWANTDHFKYRVRLGVGIDVNDQVEAVFRLSTGNTTNPVSTNTILGDFMNKDNVLFDLAYLKWQPTDFLTIYGGRMPNPWFTPTWLVWDDDLNFEGVAFKVRKPISDSLTSFLTAGVFPLQNVDPTDSDGSQHNKWLFGGQVGLEKNDLKGISAKVGVAYYYFSNITGVLNPNPQKPGLTDWSAPLFQQRGNTYFYIDQPNSFKIGLASEFRELNVGGSLDIGFWDPYHFVLAGDYVENLAFDQSKVNAVAGFTDDKGVFHPAPKDTTGYQIGASVGYQALEKFGQWKAQFQYKYIGRDAVVDAFTDSDFHLGGTNAKGWILGADVALRKNVWLSVKWLTSNEISGPTLSVDTLFLDLNARF